MKQIILAVMAVTVIAGPASAGWGSIGDAFDKVGEGFSDAIVPVGDELRIAGEDGKPAWGIGQ